MHLQKGFGLYAPRSDVETETTVSIILSINMRLFFFFFLQVINWENFNCVHLQM